MQFYEYQQHCFTSCCGYLLKLHQQGSSNENSLHNIFKTSCEYLFEYLDKALYATFFFFFFFL